MEYFGPLKCCSLRIFVFAIGILCLLIQTALLISTFVLMRDIESHVNELIQWFSDRGVSFPPPKLVNGTIDTEYQDYRTYLVKKSGDFMAIPITINVLLIISDTLLIWASAAKTKLLLWPWLILHLLEALFFLALMIFFMVIFPQPMWWYKVVIFLVACPLVVFLVFFWTVVKCFYNYLRDLGLKSAVAAVYQNGYKKRYPSSAGAGPPTVYAPEPHSWDHPVPVWAMRPPPSVWDPEYLQQLDPRYQPDRAKAARSLSHLSGRKPTQVLPDGTLVVPIGSESEPELEDESKFGSVRTSLSDKYTKPVDALPHESLVMNPILVTSQTRAKSLNSEDLSSIVSLSDKYRQQEEVEIFQEHYMRPPPEPIRPPGGGKTNSTLVSSTSSQSTASSSKS